MKTVLKKRSLKVIVLIIAFFIGLLLFGGSIFSQTLKNTTWKLQNPDVNSDCETIGFSRNYVFNNSIKDLESHKSFTLKGIYELYGDRLIVTIGEKSSIYHIIWVSAKIITLSLHGNISKYAMIKKSDNYLTKVNFN